MQQKNDNTTTDLTHNYNILFGFWHVGAVISEDLSKLEDKEDVKKESEDGKSAKKVDDSEASPVLWVFSLIPLIRLQLNLSPLLLKGH